MAALSDATLTELNKQLPSTWSKGNPVDVIGDAAQDRYEKALSAVIRDEGVDGALVILTPQSMTDIEAIARGVVSVTAGCGKTVARQAVQIGQPMTRMSGRVSAASSRSCLWTFPSRIR